jgi:proline iminopeptidase
VTGSGEGTPVILREHLGLDRVHLYGHSWGTILAVEYYRRHPEHVSSLVLASAVLDIPAWIEHTRALLTTLPDSMQEAVRRREADGDFEAADYQAALNEFYGRFVYLHPVAADLDSTFATFGMGVYGYMWGPSEFTATGTLQAYDATSFLPRLAVPVLHTVGEFDEAGPETIRRQASLTPGARFVEIPGAAHMTPWDNPAANLEAVRGFLRDVDAGG